MLGSGMAKERSRGGFGDDCGVNEENDGSSLEEDDDCAYLNCGEWNQVEIGGEGGRSKTMRTEDEYKVMFTFATMGEMSNYMRLTKVLKKAFGNIKSAKYLSNNRVRVFCLNKKQQEIAIKIKELGGIGVICHVPGVENGIKGVIYGVPLPLTDEVLRNQITGIKVTEVKRLTSNRYGKREMSTTVVIGMNEKILPVNVKIALT